MSLSVFLTWIITHIFMFGSGIWLYFKYKQTKSARVGYFAKYLLTGTIGMWILLFSFYFTKGTLAPPYGPWGFLIGALTKTLGMSYLIRLIVSFIWPKKEKIIFWIAVAVLAVFAIFGLNSLVGTGSPIPYAVRLGAVLFFVAMISLPGLWMVVTSFKSAERTIKMRGFIIGLGLLFFGVSIEGAFGFAGFVPLYFYNMVVAIATLLFFVGIVWGLKKEKPEVILPSIEAEFAAAGPKVQW